MKISKSLKRFMYLHKTKICVALNIASLIFILATLNFYDTDPDIFGRIFVICTVNLILHAFVVLFGVIDKKTKNELKPIIENVTLDFIHKMHTPIVIVDWRGYILWFNGATSEFISDSDINRRSISAVTQNQLSIEHFTADTETVDINLKDKKYSVRIYELSSYESSLYVFTFDDATALDDAKTNLELKEPVVAYFMVDNLSEVMQKMQGKYRTVSGEVSDLLHKFMQQCGGVAKEYEKDKYMCLFETENLRNFTKSKFSILDSVRAIRIEELNMSVTMSGGVSNMSGTLAEKEAAAHQALDLALQRGGDQIVLKGGASIEIYGGKTKTVTKKTRVRSRVVANELTTLMKSSSNVIIMGHRFADSDSIGACAGIARLAFSSGCKANIVVNVYDKNIRPAIMKLKDVEDYRDIFQNESSAFDMITSETLVVAVDVSNPAHFESADIYKSVYKTAVIDHHRKTSEFEKEPDIVYIEPSASSASELVAEMLEQILDPGELLREEAELLLAGIILDTQQFSRNTGTRTFSAALYLRGEGGNPSDAVSMFKTDLEEFTKEAKFESNIIVYRNVVAISICESEMHMSDKVAGAKAANRMLSIEGVAASFVLFRIDNTVHISARSLGDINVQIILETFGGGGHFDAAGAQVKNSTVKEVVIALERAIDEYFDAA